MVSVVRCGLPVCEGKTRGGSERAVLASGSRLLLIVSGRLGFVSSK